jgi:hypothetical protein
VGSAFDVVPAALVVAEAIEDDDIEGVVCAAIAAAVQPVPVDAAAAGGDGGNSAQVGERCLRSDPLRVVAGGRWLAVGKMVSAFGPHRNVRRCSELMVSAISCTKLDVASKGRRGRHPQLDAFSR